MNSYFSSIWIHWNENIHGVLVLDSYYIFLIFLSFVSWWGDYLSELGIALRLGRCQTIIHPWLLMMYPRYDDFISGKCWRSIKWLASLVGDMVTMKLIPYRFLNFRMRLIVEHTNRLIGFSINYIHLTTFINQVKRLKRLICVHFLLDWEHSPR